MLLNNVVIPGDVVIMPKQLNSNISYNILKEAQRKYNNTMKDFNGSNVIIVQVKNIKIKKIKSKIIRSSNSSATRFFLRMVVNILNIKELDTLNCTVTGLNKDFIDASISLSKRVIVLIFIDPLAFDDPESKFRMEGVDIIIKETGRKLTVGDNISVSCVEVLQSMLDLVVLSALVDTI